MGDLEDYKIEVEADVKKIAGVIPQLDDTDKLAVSLYGKGTNPGDIPLTLVSSILPLLKVAIYTSAGSAYSVGASDSDGKSVGYSISGPIQPMLFNSSSWDRQRGNVAESILSVAARTATTNSPDKINYNNRGILIFFAITAVPGADTVTLTLTAKSPLTGWYETLLTGAAEVGAATRCYLCYPGAGAAVNGVDVVTAFPLPRQFRITITHSGVGSFTYSVSATLIL